MKVVIKKRKTIQEAKGKPPGDETKTMTSEPVEPGSIDLNRADLEITRKELWGTNKSTIMQAAKRSWLPRNRETRMDDWEGTNDERAINVLANDPDAGNRIDNNPIGEMDEFRGPITKLISDAQGGLESLSEEQKKLFLRFLMITGLEFALHAKYVPRDGSYREIVTAHLEKYLRNPSKNPKSLSDGWKKSSKQYGTSYKFIENNPIILDLRESKRKIKVFIAKR